MKQVEKIRVYVLPRFVNVEEKPRISGLGMEVAQSGSSCYVTGGKRGCCAR